jgi:hypothetical protein
MLECQDPDYVIGGRFHEFVEKFATAIQLSYRHWLVEQGTDPGNEPNALYWWVCGTLSLRRIVR